MSINETMKITFRCYKVQQPVGEFYVGIIDHKDLLFISYADIRRLSTGSELREVEIYTGIQRPLSRNRVKEIGDYVNLIDASFPTSIILHVEQEDAEYNESEETMTLPYKNSIAKILDGQHRIAGLEHFENDGRKFELNVTIFVGMELEDQAILFATINKAQTKVNKSLVADLFEFAKSRSPQKTAHNIIRALHQKPGSPFEKKIKILGNANDKEKETITQATFADCLIRYISKEPMKDRDIYKREKTPPKYTDKDLKARPFRNLFIEEEDSKIAKIIWNYFSAVRSKWPDAWNNVEPEMILNRSTGFISLMKFLIDCYVSFNRIGEIITEEEFSEIFQRIDIQSGEFNREKYIPGSGGQSQLYKDLKEKSGLQPDIYG